MNCYGVFHTARVASRQSDHQRTFIFAGVIHYQGVAAGQAFHSQRQAAELVFPVGVGACDVKNNLRCEFGEGFAQMLVEDREIIFVTYAVWQVDVHGGWRLDERIVVQLVDREREHAFVAGENCGSAVAMVNVGVDHHCSFNCFVVLQAADGDGYIVDYAEAFTVIRAGVVESAADIRGPAVVQRFLAREDCPASGQPAGFDQFLRVWYFELQDFGVGERAGFQFADVLARVDAEDIFVSCWLRRKKIAALRDSAVRQAFVNQAILL